MKSLRGQLLWGVTLGTTVVFVASGVVLDVLIGRALWAGFDDALATQARALTALAEQTEEGLEFEPAEGSSPNFAAGDRPSYYQVWRADGGVLARSSSLKQANLARLTGPHDVPTFRSVRLPGGEPGRMVGLTFVPRQENAATDAPTTVTLVVGRETSALTASLQRIRRTLVSVGLISVGFAGAVWAWVVRRGLRPLDELSRRIAGLGADDLTARLDAAGAIKELRPVVERLNDLLVRLEAAFQRERRFTGDVAHELRTPLAGLRAKLEVALSRDRVSEAYREAMRDGLRINSHMQRTVENLLHLARADAGQLELHRQPVDLPEVVRECWSSLAEKATGRKLSVDWRLETMDAVETDREQLHLVIQNVLDNAVAHANDGGRIMVSAWGDNGWTRLTVSNTGSMVPNEQIGRVFDRFWRGDATFGRPGQFHCGLGLPLCKAVMGQLGGTIEAEASTTGDFTVTVRLPGRTP